MVSDATDCSKSLQDLSLTEQTTFPRTSKAKELLFSSLNKFERC